MNARIRRFVKMSGAERLGALKWQIGNATDRFYSLLWFSFLTWKPSDASAVYASYYPESARWNPELRQLFHRWIRGNRLNNNGDVSRFMALNLNINQVMRDGVPGNFAELGVWKGNSAAILANIASRNDRKVFLFDTFTGFDARDLTGVDRARPRSFDDTSVSYVQETVGITKDIEYIRGFFPKSITEEASNSKYAVVHLDCDLYEPMQAGLEFFYDRMPAGGLLIMHDYSSGSWPGATRAVDEFCLRTGEKLILWPDKSGSASIRKSHANT